MTSYSELVIDTHWSLLSVAKVRVSNILDGPLGKATVKANSITDSKEESVAADKTFSSKDRSGRGQGRVCSLPL